MWPLARPPSMHHHDAGDAMASKYQQHIDRDEIVKIVCDLVRLKTVNPPGHEHLCREIVSERMQALGIEVSSYEKEPGRTNVVGRIKRGRGRRSIGFVSHMDVVPAGELNLWET